MFDQEKRFKRKKTIIEPGYIGPRSELSSKGIKIIDSWVPRDVRERLPYNLTIRNGLLLPIESKNNLFLSDKEKREKKKEKFSFISIL